MQDGQQAQELLRTARQAAEQFEISGKCEQLSALKKGHINDTFYSVWVNSAGGSCRFIHQRLNHHVFPNIPGIMSNVRQITSHLKTRLAQSGSAEQTLELVRAKSGLWTWQDSEGYFWRTFVFIEGSESFDVCPGAAHGEAVGAAFGRFLRLLADFDSRNLAEPISRFQDLAMRFEHLAIAIEANKAGRASEAADLIAFLRSQRDLASLVSRKVIDGEIPLRVTHADPKVNNVLFKKGSTQVTAVVDLDTCMQGTAIYDYGDMIRSASVPVAEDERDLAKVRIDEQSFECITRGYLSEVGRILTPAELELLPMAPALIAFSLSMRFLSDHLNGDAYFKVNYPGHNLVRARTQTAILESVLRSQKSLAAVVDRALQGSRSQASCAT